MEITKTHPSSRHPSGVENSLRQSAHESLTLNSRIGQSDENSVKRDLRDVLWVAIPKLLGGGLQVIFNLLLLRHLGPKPFGTVSVCLATVMLCDSIFGSAIDMSIFRLAPLQRLRNPVGALQIQKVGLLSKPVGAMLAVLPIALFGPRLSLALFQTGENAPLLYLTLGALLGTLVIRSAQVHFQIERQFMPYGVTGLANTVLCFGTLGALLLADVCLPSAILAVYAAVPLTVSAAILATRARAIILVRASSEAVVVLLRTLKWLLPTVIVGSLLSRMDLYFVSAFAGVNEAGIYSAAQVFALLPALIGLYMSAVFSPRVMPLWYAGKLKPIFLCYQVGLATIAVLIFVVAALSLNRITGLLLPESFRRSKDVILALLPAGLCSFFSFPWMIPLLLYLRPKLLLLIDCFGVLVLAPVFIATARHEGAVGVAKLTSAVMVVRAVVHQWLAWRTLGSAAPGQAGQGALLVEENLYPVRTL
jgi:O-antigen/teichoic acid export membrane protein